MTTSPLDSTPPGQQSAQDGWSLGGGRSTSSFIPKPWMSQFGQARLPNPLAANRKRKNKQSEPTIKKNIPFVKLVLSSSGNRAVPEVDSVQENLYIKLPESSICVTDILAEAANRIPGNPSPDDLFLLDSKLIRVTGGTNSALGKLCQL